LVLLFKVHTINFRNLRHLLQIHEETIHGECYVGEQRDEIFASLTMSINNWV
jgi:hypothetical protein